MTVKSNTSISIFLLSKFERVSCSCYERISVLCSCYNGFKGSVDYVASWGCGFVLHYRGVLKMMLRQGSLHKKNIHEKFVAKIVHYFRLMHKKMYGG